MAIRPKSRCWRLGRSSGITQVCDRTPGAQKKTKLNKVANGRNVGPYRREQTAGSRFFLNRPTAENFCPLNRNRNFRQRQLGRLYMSQARGNFRSRLKCRLHVSARILCGSFNRAASATLDWLVRQDRSTFKDWMGCPRIAHISPPPRVLGRMRCAYDQSIACSTLQENSVSVLPKQTRQLSI